MADVLPNDVIEIIDRTFGGRLDASELSSADSHHLAGLVDLVEQIPGRLLLALPVEHRAAVVTALAAIRDYLNKWTYTSHPDNHRLRSLEAFDNLNAVRLIRRSLEECPADFPSPDTAELSFIGDPKVRQSLRLDIAAVDRALENDEWKAATVIAGSVVEALLLWALQQKRPTDLETASQAVFTGNAKKGKITAVEDLEKEHWRLADYIDMAAHLNIIKPGTKQQAQQAKDFRDLIHRCVAIRRQKEPTRGTARAAAAAVDLVVEDLPAVHGGTP